MVVGEIFSRNARRHPKETAIIFEQTRYTWEEFNKRINRLANGLLSLGLKRGDRIAAILDNRHQHIELIGAAAKGGFILVPLSTKLKDELPHIVGNAQPNCFVVEEAYLSRIRSDWKFVKNIICMGKSAEGIEGYEELLAKSSEKEPTTEVHEEDVLFIYYTSGTTSLPKGASLTHKNVLVNAVNMVINYGFAKETINLTVHPLYFTAPINCTVIPAVYMGGTTVILREFNPKAFLEAVQKEKVTHVHCVPTMIIRLLEFPELHQYDWSSIRLLMYGSASMPVSRLKDAIAKFGNIFSQAYGLTEIVALATILTKEEHIVEGPGNMVRRLGSCGKEITNCQVKVVRKDGSEVARDGKEVGEIIIRGDHVMKGYWKMPEVTAETIKKRWLHSGDLAVVDEDGYIYIIDRSKDMIISGAINIYPREIEEVLYTHPAILEAAVIGEANEEWGEIVKAVIVLREGQKAGEEEIIQYCKDHLASYKKPKKVVFMQSLPKTPTGKILKRDLRKMLS